LVEALQKIRRAVKYTWQIALYCSFNRHTRRKLTALDAAGSPANCSGSNAVRHAKPTIISVNLRCHPPNLVLEVTDDGSGIDDSQAASREGFGFSNMRARAENI
jgi:signal transduction histidine kinase